MFAPTKQGINPGRKKHELQKNWVGHSTEEKWQENVLKSKGMLLKTSAKKPSAIAGCRAFSSDWPKMKLTWCCAQCIVMT